MWVEVPLVHHNDAVVRDDAVHYFRQGNGFHILITILESHIVEELCPTSLGFAPCLLVSPNSGIQDG